MSSLRIFAAVTVGLVGCLTAACTPDMPQPLPTPTPTPTSLSPIEAAFATIYGTAGVSEEELTDQHEARELEAENEVAACMLAAGFSYVPYVDHTEFITTTELDEFRDLDPVEQARQIGYGFIADVRANNGQVAGVENPNDVIRHSLSPAGQEAYGRALVGFIPDSSSADPTDAAESDGEDYSDFVPGCYQQTSNTAQAGLFEADPIWTEFLADRDAFDTRLAQNGQLVALNQHWSDCIADAGWPGLEMPQAAFELAHAEWTVWANDPSKTELPTAAQFGAMQEREVTIALADAICQEELSYQEVHRAIQDPLEQAFVDERAEDIAYLQSAYAYSQS